MDMTDALNTKMHSQIFFIVIFGSTIMFEIKELVLNITGNGSNIRNARGWIPYQLPLALSEFWEVYIKFKQTIFILVKDS